jgi:hypothetical protein
MEETQRTQNVSIDLGHILIPDLPKHMHSSTLLRVQTPSLAEVSNVEAQTLVVWHDGDVEVLRSGYTRLGACFNVAGVRVGVGIERRLGEEEDGVAMVRCALLRVRWEVFGVLVQVQEL